MPKLAKLVSTKTLLEHDGDTLGGPVFVSGREPGESLRHTRVILDGDVWLDMGEPEWITVTIEPGVRGMGN